VGTDAAIRVVTAVGPVAWVGLVVLNLIALGCAVAARRSGRFERGRLHLWLFGLTLEWGPADQRDEAGSAGDQDR
jgi:hypothetical protein